MKHGFDFADLNEAYFVDSTIVSANIGRSMAIGIFNGTVIAVIFTFLGGEGLSIISMRKASRKERMYL